MQYRDSRQEVTGLVANKKVNVKSEYYRTTRAMCNELFRKGACYAGSKKQPRKLSDAALRGRLSFIYSIKGHDIEFKRIPRGAKSPAFYQLYYKFLDYASFYSMQKPLVICEGDTDNVYIACALASLANSFPSLAIPNKPLHEGLKIKLFNYTDTTGAVQHLSGGSGDLAGLVRHYAARLSEFVGPASRRPVILIVDDDSGGDQVFKAVREMLKVPSFAKHPFVHVMQNLYIVPVPIVSGSSSKIEDLFQASVLKMKLDGKTFSDTANFDTTRHYGKRAFAEKVIKVNRTRIDYSGFRPLFISIEAAIADFEHRNAKRAAA